MPQESTTFLHVPCMPLHRFDRILRHPWRAPLAAVFLTNIQLIALSSHDAGSRAFSTRHLDQRHQLCQRASQTVCAEGVCACLHFVHKGGCDVIHDKRWPGLKSNLSAYPVRYGVGERGSWDLGRFVKTVSYFNKPPSPGEVLSAIVSQPAKVLSALTGGTTEVRVFSRRLFSQGLHRQTATP